jgi:hypothetical protein
MAGSGDGPSGRSGDIAPQGEQPSSPGEALPFARTLAGRSEPAGVDIHGPTLPSPDPMRHPASRAAFDRARAPSVKGRPAPLEPATPASRATPPAGAVSASSVGLGVLVALVFALAGALGFLALRVWTVRRAAPQEIHDAR